MRGIYIPVTPTERDAIIRLAEREKREARYQAALLLRERLEQLGLLQPTPVAQEATNEQPRC